MGRERPRVFLMSFDGLGQERLTADPAAEPLVAVRGLMKTGAYADGLMPAYPSTTANGHAALWTGTYAGRNGILYNTTPRLPRSEHELAEKAVGFRSEELRAEPIWLVAARQGRSVVSHQATQVYPFLPQTVSDRPYPKLLVANGFQSRSFAPWRLIRAGFEWDAGPARFRAVLADGGLRIGNAAGGPTVLVKPHASESQDAGSRPLARYWSAPLPVTGLPDNTPAYVAFRLFSMKADGSDFELLQTPIQEMAVYSGAASDPKLAGAMLSETGPVVGNAAGSMWSRGELGKQAYAGGDGEAERRFLETVELQVRQQIAELRWLVVKRDPDLVTTYLASIDDIDHQWLGLDRALNIPAYRDFRRRGFAIVNRAAEALLALSSKDDHVVVTSDHGLTPVEWLVPVSRVLQRIGLPVVSYSTCVVVNTTDWKNGTVKPDQRETVLDRVEATLRKFTAPDGKPIVTKVYRSREDMAFFGHDGPGGADLCFDMRPGFAPGEAGDGDSVQHPRNGASGQHGLDPHRADMNAVLLVQGPRAARGRSLGPQRSGCVAALVADLLGINPPRDAAFPSPLTKPTSSPRP